MIHRLFTAAFVSSPLLSLAAFTAGCTLRTDVSLNPKYQQGWVPGREYELRRPMALVHDTGTGVVYFEPDKVDLPLGSVVGWVSSHDQVLVEHAPAGTRFQVEKLIRDNNWPMMTVTTAEGHILSERHKGSIVALYTVSGEDRIGELEIVQSRDDNWVAPVP
jgi:hypothetical protein